MAVITLPDELKSARVMWSHQRRDLGFSSPFGSQAVEISGPKWGASLTAPVMNDDQVGAWQALLLRLGGKTNQLALWNQVRPAPRGTMRGTMLLSAAAAQGATTLSISAAGEAGKTLLQGDYLGIGSGSQQHLLFMLDNATADGSGVILANIHPPLRNAFVLGTAVVWDKPKALFRAAASRVEWEYPRGNSVKVGVLDLVEDWRP